MKRKLITCDIPALSHATRQPGSRITLEHIAVAEKLAESSSSASAPASINLLVNRFTLFPGLLVRPVLHASAQNSINSLLSD
jgi:hypothetical protein